MYFALIKSFEGLTYYGNIPNVPELPDDRVEVYDISWDDAELFDDDLDDLNHSCNSILDFYDVDYFDADKCKLLKKWLLLRIDKKTDNRYRELLEILIRYAERAIELNTGVVIEL